MYVCIGLTYEGRNQSQSKPRSATLISSTEKLH